MDLGINKKVAVITGAGEGIGKSCAEVLGAEGCKIAISDVQEEAGMTTAAELKQKGIDAVFVKGDVSVREDVGNLIRTAYEAFGSIDILVNNAAISPKVPFDKITQEEFSSVVNVNLLGPFLCSMEAFKYMKEKKWGRIICMSSMAGRYGANYAGLHYATTKAGILGFAMTLGKKMGPYGITVNAVAPGRIDTRLTRVLPKEERDRIASQIPLGYIGTAEDVANVVAFLSSEAARYVTGTCVDIMGGYIA